MAVYTASGEVIEGLSIECVVRRWDWKGLKLHPIYRKRMTLYVTDRNSTSRILKCINEPDDEDLKQKTAHYHRQENDILKADALTVYVDNIRKITPIVKEGVTGRHGANIVQSSKHTIAEIRTPLNMMRKALGLNNNQLKD